MLNIALKKLEAINELCGRSIAWLTLGMVLLTFLIVILRYWFDIGSIAMQESVTYMHAIVFMLGAAYTLKHEGHVRVDIFYQNFSRKQKAIVDLCGSLFLLLPVSVFIFIVSWDYVLNAWSLKEGSREAGGLPLVYLLKTVMLIMPLLLCLQACALIIKNLLNIRHPEQTQER